ncbi:uncharacterized protein LOC116779628 [Danaus plexippus]|uniref:uncharacterized protein LOC116779628 n=1 Tax=Danaus plexippus TaxID=13037 RepID=UPI002AB3113F|nr:uncharacterized protein LOC116779628 [Danaus plexippus]
MWCFLLLTFFVAVQGRAVNISNTWVLPEEGFPVFYRYFRDRISWYEADAVCQFHHANLVTVDTTAQYDAVRAYLKELDISSAVWVGLIRSNPDGDFTWTDYRGLSGDGYWSAAPDTRSAPLCAAADPAADYRWEARACGGPSVASFICELPVPQWALGNEGCMVRALPALTILYLPESAAVQLTADCGLAGVKRVQCTGNVKREDLLKELACTEEDQTTLTSNGTSPITSWQMTTDSIFNNQYFNNEGTGTEENVTTEHEDDINQSSPIKVISTSFTIIPDTSNKVSLKPSVTEKLFKTPLQKHIDIISNNYIQQNETPKLVHDDDLFTNEQNNQQGNDKMLQYTKLHDELARLGNSDTVFSQPTDHFVPPLVMAKAKISDDLTALSIKEKLAQQLSEQQLKHEIQQEFTATANSFNKELYRTEAINNPSTTSLPLINISTSSKVNKNKDNENENISIKKTKNKYMETKQKSFKNGGTKALNTISSDETTPTLSQLNTQNNIITSTMGSITEHTQGYPTKPQSIEETSLELTVILREPNENTSFNDTVVSTNRPLISNKPLIQNNMADNETEIPTTSSHVFPSSTQENNLNEDKFRDMNVSNDKHKDTDNFFYVTTKSLSSNDNVQTKANDESKDLAMTNSLSVLSLIKKYNNSATNINLTSENSTIDASVTIEVIEDAKATNKTVEPESELKINDTRNNFFNFSENEPFNVTVKEGFDSIIDSNFDLDRNMTSDTDDFQSPLLSAASEPLPKPNRSRRIQQQTRNKFNPFRILG